MITRIKFVVLLLCVLVFWAGQGTVEAKPTAVDNSKDDLVAQWNFKGDGVDFVNNERLNGMDGDIYGAVRDGFGAMIFDGENDYIAIRGVTRLASLGKGSISVWFKFDTFPSEGIHPIFYAGDGENSGLIIEVGHLPLFSTAKLFFTINTAGGESNHFTKPVFCYDSAEELNTGEWYHFVAVVGDDYNTGYLNGDELKLRHYNFAVGDYDDKQKAGPTNSIFFNDVAISEVWIGKGVFLSHFENHFHGLIDDVRIYDEPLRPAQVDDLYTKGPE